jgi:hypothetical protein
LRTAASGAPSAGPTSAYPTLSGPELICFSDPKDVFVPGFIVGSCFGFALPVCARADPIMPTWAAAMDIAAVPKKLRRS